jgi:hypothetical protein
MASSKYAFSSNGQPFCCANPNNTAVCQALLNKAAAYPPEKEYNRAATMLAAKRVSELTESLSSFTWTGPRGGQNPPPCRELFGLSIRRFIRDFLKNPRAAAVVCAHPDNQPVYQALIDKSNSYLPEKMWNARAYARAAAELAACTTSLKGHYAVAYTLPGCGYKTQRFIYETASRVFCPTACRENEGLYNYLQRFASMASATRGDARAAECVAACTTRLQLDIYGVLSTYIPGLTRETRSRIEDYLVASANYPYIY